MGKAIVIGGGIIGLSSAYYLQQSGWGVTLLDKDDFSDNCSYGNAGYVCPSHFIPLATPGIVTQGLKWMWNSRSPFYVEPRLNAALISWGLKFMKSATAKHVAESAIPLRDIALLSQQLYEEWTTIPGFDFAYEKKGLLEMFQTEANEEHSHHVAEEAKKLGLEAVMLSKEEVQAMEPQVELNIRGALYFKCDAHLYPQKLMKGLLNILQQKSVQLIPQQEVTGFEMSNDQIKSVISNKQRYDADMVVIATGSWSREMAAKLGLNLPLMPGRGYSVTLEDSPFTFNHPAVLQEGRVAITPMDRNKIRFGGTMEITSIKTPPRYKRVEGILNAVERFVPQFKIPMPSQENIWYGYRPCSADGLPYIGKIKSNAIIATGHAMIGLSVGAGTGKLVAEIANGETPSVDINPYNPKRFS
ncbi:NAD(P)/FAD-dependent oxidoreductase [Lacibacter sediminis]|uniref:FAD-dependent oxidoreductase n=1 Tax=Lacibacter sediminis TaxID=2760713 RepID=A0A7G5XDX2_9BACT|nr:FAD-dependent oxidoreductase [Lacibacter sediminis]QNA43675.1 FAD-dependent oxidoreductase [Lacibacter sediminis]